MAGGEERIFPKSSSSWPFLPLVKVSNFCFASVGRQLRKAKRAMPRRSRNRKRTASCVERRERGGERIERGARRKKKEEWGKGGEGGATINEPSRRPRGAINFPRLLALRLINIIRPRDRVSLGREDGPLLNPLLSLPLSLSKVIETRKNRFNKNGILSRIEL